MYLSSIAYVVAVHLSCIGSFEPSLVARALNTKLAYAVSAYAGLVLSARVNREGSADSDASLVFSARVNREGSDDSACEFSIECTCEQGRLR